MGNTGGHLNRWEGETGNAQIDFAGMRLIRRTREGARNRHERVLIIPLLIRITPAVTATRFTRLITRLLRGGKRAKENRDCVSLTTLQGDLLAARASKRGSVRLLAGRFCRVRDSFRSLN